MKFTTIIIVLVATCACTEATNTFYPFVTSSVVPSSSVWPYSWVNASPYYQYVSPYYQYVSSNVSYGVPSETVVIPSLRKVNGDETKTDKKANEKKEEIPAPDNSAAKKPAETEEKKPAETEEKKPAETEEEKKNRQAAEAEAAKLKDKQAEAEAAKLDEEDEEDGEDEVDRKFGLITKEIKHMKKTLKTNVGQPLAHVQEKLNIYRQLVDSFKLTARTLQRKNKKARKVAKRSTK